MNSGESTAGSGFGDVSNQPSPIESSQSQVSAADPNLRAVDRPFQAVLEAAIDTINHVNAAIASFRVLTNREWEYSYLSVGNEAIFGYTAEEFIANKSLWLAQVHPEDQVALLACFEQALQAGTTTVEYRCYHKDGTLRWISSTFTARSHESGEGWMVTAIGTDITYRKQTELALEATKERYVLAVNAGQVGVWDWNIETNEVHIDAELKTMLGFTADEISNEIESWQQLIYPADLDRATQAMSDYLEGRSPTYALEHRMLHKDGSVLWFLTRGGAFWGADGQPYRMVGTRTNITERKQLELALQRSETKLHEILNSATAAISRIRVFADRTFEAEYRSAGCETVFGYTQQELMSDATLWYRQVLPEDWERVILPSLEDIFATRPYTIEYRFRHKNGTLRWIAETCTSQWDETANCWIVTIVSTDISDRKQLDLALQDSEARLSAILDSAIAAIFHFRVFADQDWEYDYFSAGCETIFGYSPAELLADKFLWLSRVPPEDRDGILLPLFEDFFAERPATAEYCFFHQDESLRWISTSYTSQRDEAANCWIVAAVSVDITDRKQAEEAVRQQAVWEQLLRTITQRIRESLNLDQILSTAVTEIQQVLLADQALIFRLDSDASGHVIKTATVPEYPLPEHLQLPDELFSPDCYEHYRQGQPRIVLDVENDAWEVNWVELMRALEVRSKVLAPITHHAENGSPTVWGLLIVHACSYQRRWSMAEAEFLQQISNQLAIAIQQADFYQRLQSELAERRQTELAMQQVIEREQQIRERERFIATIAQNIRRSLNLTEILNTTVAEVRRFLEVDRVVIYCFNPDWNGQIVAESLAQESFSIIHEYIDDPCFQNLIHRPYQQGHIQAVNDILTADLQPCYLELLLRLQVRAVLVVPILVQQDLWGLLIAHQCTGPREWQQISWYLLRQLSTQLAIGIHQAELYRQVQQLNTNLESQVQDRTAALQQSLEFEALLKRITDNVRDSLDENQILQTAVRELATGLDVECCNTDVYDLEQATCTVRSEYTITLPPCLGQVTQMSALPGVFRQLLQGQYLQFCLTIPNPARPECQSTAILTCPIFDDQGVLGDLWLFRATDAVFNEPEIRLVQQVANQCAIAIRQARLYDAANAQVAELERLNRLKDDFLSSVSHELRTPVSSIKMATQMLEIILFGSAQNRQPQENEQDMSALTLDAASLQRLRRYFQILQDESQREINLINNLLDLTRLDAETEPLFTNTIDLQVWLPHVVEPFLERIQTHQQQLQIDLPADLPSLTTDLSYLQRILSELLTNACKYTPAGGIIRMSARFGGVEGSGEQAARRKGNRTSPLLISVTNIGVEIPSYELPRIFDKFYRIPNNDPWKYGGTGLGLALVQKLVNRLGATVQVTSGEGQTTFTLRFSIAQ